MAGIVRGRRHRVWTNLQVKSVIRYDSRDVAVRGGKNCRKIKCVERKHKCQQKNERKTWESVHVCISQYE